MVRVLVIKNKAVETRDEATELENNHMKTLNFGESYFLCLYLGVSKVPFMTPCSFNSNTHQNYCTALKRKEIERFIFEWRM